ncbi:MAG: NusA N-terminal domain-containing protein, partial [Victivallis sp.]
SPGCGENAMGGLIWESDCFRFSTTSSGSGISRDSLIRALENAILIGSRKSIHPANELKVKIDPATGAIRAWAMLEVVEENPTCEPARRRPRPGALPGREARRHRRVGGHAAQLRPHRGADRAAGDDPAAAQGGEGECSGRVRRPGRHEF